MSYILDETADFDADITVPEGDDVASAEVLAAAFQKLANRSRMLYTRGAFTPSGSGLADTDRATLAAVSVPDNSGFTLSDTNRKVEVPSAGWYKVTVNVDATISLASGHFLKLMVNGSEPTPHVRVYDKFSTGFGLVHITDPATQLLWLQVDSGSAVDITSGTLLIEKVSG